MITNKKQLIALASFTLCLILMGIFSLQYPTGIASASTPTPTSLAKVLRLEQITCENNSIRVRFSVSNLLPSTTEYGRVRYYTNNGDPRMATFVSRSGGTAFYDDSIPKTLGIYSITGADIAIESILMVISNPGSIPLTCGQATPTPTPSPTRSPTPTPQINDDNPVRLALSHSGKNITKGETADQSSIAASPNDTLEFVLLIKNRSPLTLTNVIAKDPISSLFVYVANSTSKNGIIINDGIATGGGINIGSLLPDQEATIKFSARVVGTSAFAKGTTTVNMTAEARADNSSIVTDRLTILITNGGSVAGASISDVSDVSTGTAGSIALSLAISSLATYLYFGYSKSGLAKKNEILKLINKHRSDPSRLNFAKFT